MGLAQLGDEFVDLDGLTGPAGEFSHLREPSGSESVVLGAGLHQLVLDETLVDRQYGEWVDLLVHLHQLAPRVVAVQCEGMGEVPREHGLLQGEQREQHRVAGTRRKSGHHLVAVFVP